MNIKAGKPGTNFKVTGYYPSWEPEKTDRIQYDNLTHINYSFAIPTVNGSLLPLNNSDTAEKIIKQAHKEGVKVLLVVGGWSYQDIPLEATFMEATDNHEKVTKLGNAIIEMAKQYGFDGVDIDWEHPRMEGSSRKQYEELMLYLKGEADKNQLLLTAAVLSGVTAEGEAIPDAFAQTDTVLGILDWVHVMAYDGGDGIRHSSYEFAVNSAKYWIDTRKMPKEKVVLGVPFYARPSWSAYSDILSRDSDGYNKDVFRNGEVEDYYNGIPTIREKTKWALEHAGGIMIWELSQDTKEDGKSLLRAIGDTVKKQL